MLGSEEPHNFFGATVPYRAMPFTGHLRYCAVVRASTIVWFYIFIFGSSLHSPAQLLLVRGFTLSDFLDKVMVMVTLSSFPPPPVLAFVSIAHRVYHSQFSAFKLVGFDRILLRPTDKENHLRATRLSIHYWSAEGAYLITCAIVLHRGT